MELPIKTFWFMGATINRVRAETDSRNLLVGLAAQGGEFATKHQQRLVLETQGKSFDGVVRPSDERDPDASDRLRALGGG